MLRINGKKIGDVVEVTFVKSFFGVQAQERINDRLVLLEEHYRAQPGDRCRVKILAEKNPNTLLVGIESIVYKGDGKQSTLQRVLEQIKGTPRGYGDMLQGWVFVLLHAIFPKDKERVLECLLDVLEHYKLEDKGEEPTIEYAVFGREIKRLIAKLYSDDAQVEYLLRAADYCSARKEGLHVAYEMVVEAFAYCVYNRRKQAAVQAEFRRLRALIVEGITQQLLGSEKGSSQALTRLALARFLLNSHTEDEARAVIDVIEPVYDELRFTEYFPEVARLLSQAFLQLGESGAAKFWSRLSEIRIAHTRLTTSLDPLIETYMRMSPELKRRFFDKAGSGQ